MTYLTPHTTACLSAPATTALSASQRSAIGKAEGIATLLPGRTMPWAACYFAVPIPSLTLHKTDLLLQEEGKNINHKKSNFATKHEAAEELIL